MSDLIEALKNNREPFGMWPKESQEFARKIGKKEFEHWFDDKWKPTGDVDSFCNSTTYRLRPDYQEQPEFEYYEIKLHTESSEYYLPKLYGRAVDALPRYKGFVGFLGEDGDICQDFIYGWNVEGSRRVRYWTKEELESGKVVVKHAVSAVFVKEK